MDAKVSSVGDLFLGTVQYVIPEFQRSYAWEREKQWEPLWEDVVNVADRVLKSRSNGHSRVALTSWVPWFSRGSLWGTERLLRFLMPWAGVP